MHVRKFVLLAIVLAAGALFAAAQTDTSRKDQPQNQSGATSPDASKAQTGGAGSGTPTLTPQSDRGVSQKAEERLYREVRHELVMLPNLSLWDNLAYKVEGRKVTLLGQVRNAALKSEAENAVKHIEGVEEVDNQIQVLPPSPQDDRIRVAVARAIFDTPGLFPYAMQSVPPIHIIVQGGHVTLEGVVNSEADRNLAEIKAKQIPGVFSVTNHLQVANTSAEKQ
jgi:osmotically-inducible protein OsmY